MEKLNKFDMVVGVFKIAAIIICLSLITVGCDNKKDKNEDTENATNTPVTTEITTEEEPFSIANSDYPIKQNQVENNPGLYELRCVKDNYSGIWFQEIYERGGIIYLTYTASGNEADFSYMSNACSMLVINPLQDKIIADIELPCTDGYFPIIKFDENDNLVAYDVIESTLYYYDDKYNVSKKKKLDGVNDDMPVFKADLSGLYYGDLEAKTIEYVDIATNTKKTVYTFPEDMILEYLHVDGLLADDIVVFFYDSTNYNDDMQAVDYANGVVDVTTGELLCKGEDLSEAYYNGDRYIVKYQVDGNQEIISGIHNGDKKILVGKNYTSATFRNILMDSMSVITTEEEIVAEKLYMTLKDIDLNTGMVQHEIEFVYPYDMQITRTPVDICKSVEGNFVIYYCQYNESDNEIYLWDLNDENSTSTDDNNYYVPITALDDPDGLEEQREMAKTIGDKYGVDIYIGNEILDVDIFDFDCAPINNSVRITQALDIIDVELAKYPDGMLKQLDNDYCPELKIYLCGKLTSIAEGTVSDAAGLHNYGEDGRMIILDITQMTNLNYNLHHELMHAIESYSTDEEYYFEEWYSYNPKDFEYDFNYAENEINGDNMYTYLWDEGEAYFVDAYSKSFPDEDRARIMENAMMEIPDDSDGKGVFEEEKIYNKYEYLCEFIRQVFDTTGWPEVTYWERMLE